MKQVSESYGFSVFVKKLLAKKKWKKKVWKVERPYMVLDDE